MKTIEGQLAQELREIEKKHPEVKENIDNIRKMMSLEK